MEDRSYRCRCQSSADFDEKQKERGPQTADLITATGASLLFLPPYSPELNPIEKDFAIIKRIRQYNAETSMDDIIKMYH